MGGGVRFEIKHAGKSKTLFFYAIGVSFGVSPASIDDAKNNLNTKQVKLDMDAGLVMETFPVNSAHSLAVFNSAMNLDCSDRFIPSNYSYPSYIFNHFEPEAKKESPPSLSEIFGLMYLS